ncbi:histidine kinase 3-like, partial [Trifolium medium]|nr:histidine kinase 3-like [Trifolium medium]
RYLGGVFEIESLVEKLLQQLASKQTVLVNVYDTTNRTQPIPMYGSDVSGDEFYHKPPWPWMAMGTSIGILIIALLVGHIFHATVNRIANVEDDYLKMIELKKRAEAADVAKSQVWMMNMLMDTDLDVTQQEYVRTAQGSGKALVSIINEVLDQAKIESGKLELEAVLFDIRAIMDDVLSLFSEKSQGKGVEVKYICLFF